MIAHLFIYFYLLVWITKILELGDAPKIRDGISHCEYLNSDEICKLLFSICTD